MGVSFVTADALGLSVESYEKRELIDVILLVRWTIFLVQDFVVLALS